MNYLEIFITAFNSLKSNVLRTALTMLGIIIGIFAVTLILIISQGATSAITAQISSLGTNLLHIQSNRVIPLTFEDAAAIKLQIPDVTAIDETVQTSSIVSANGQSSSYAINGVNAAFFNIYDFSLSKGAFFLSDDVTGNGTLAVIGSKVASDIFGTDADPIGQLIQVGTRSFYVVGVLNEKGSSIIGAPDQTVYVPVTTAMNTILGTSTLGSIDVLVKSPDQVDLAANQVKQLLLDRHNVVDPTLIKNYAIYTSKELLKTVSSITGILSGVLTGIAGISLLVGGIGIMNIMLVTVTERIKEIGLLKAIGATRSNILTQFLIESVTLTVSGGLIGTLLGIGIGAILSHFLKVPFLLPITSIIFSTVISVVIGLVFGIYPAQRAAKMNPIDALHYE
jgi:putative ABC transport system permease protein